MALSKYYKDNAVWMYHTKTNNLDIAVSPTLEEMLTDNDELDLSALINNGSTFHQLNTGYFGLHPVVYPSSNNTSNISERPTTVQYLGAALYVNGFTGGHNYSTRDGCLFNLTTKQGQNVKNWGYYGWEGIKNIRFILNTRPHVENTKSGDVVNWDKVTNWMSLKRFFLKPWFHYTDLDNNFYSSDARSNYYDGIPTNRHSMMTLVEYNVWLTNYDESGAASTNTYNEQICGLVFVFKINDEIWITEHPEYCYPKDRTDQIPVYEPNPAPPAYPSAYVGIGDFNKAENVSKQLPTVDDEKGWRFANLAVSGVFRQCSAYVNTVNAMYYFVNSVGLRWSDRQDGIGTFGQYRETVRLGVMDSNGVIKHNQWIVGEDEILNSTNPNKDGDYSNLPERKEGGGGDVDKDEESKYGGDPWTVKDSLSINSGLIYREMDDGDIDDFKGVIARLRWHDVSYENFINHGIHDHQFTEDILNKVWKETFPTPADYVAYIYDRYGYGSDPVNSIISIMAFPFEITTGDDKSINNIGTEELFVPVPTGETSTGEVVYAQVQYYPTDETFDPAYFKYPEVTEDVFTKTVASHVITHPNGYNDFRAYAPYTRLELYIPMHGTIDLDPAVVIGKQLTVKVTVTIADGSSIATVFINDSIYQTVNGQVGYSIPLSAEASSANNLALKTISAQSQSQKLNAVGNIIHGLASAAGSIATGSYGSAAGSVVDMVLTGQQNAITNKTVKYQIEHATDGKVVVGQPSSLNAFMIHPKCQLIWHLPLMQAFNSATYGKTIGYKCYKTATLGSVTGYTECSNACLDNVNCTEAEKAMILEQLKNGIII